MASPSSLATTGPVLGVVIVTFNSADVILDCLESLLAASGVRLRIVVVDNASADGTPDLLRAWAAGTVSYAPPVDLPFALAVAKKPLTLLPALPPPGAAGHSLTLIEASVNGGYAAGVNPGLALLLHDSEIDRFWILNPDSVVPAHTPRAFATEPGPDGGFALMGGRVIYLDRPDMIQIDGGLLNPYTGITGNANLGLSHAVTPPPDPADLTFVMGGNMIAARAFCEGAGPLPEDYFLYYEEVDWALRRGGLPLAYCKDAIVYHRAGTAIGSPTLERIASAFSIYFKHRARMRFMRKHFPQNLATAYAYSCAKAAQLLVKGYPTEARALLAASFDRPPPSAVRARLSPEAARLAFDVPKTGGKSWAQGR